MVFMSDSERKLFIISNVPFVYIAFYEHHFTKMFRTDDALLLSLSVVIEGIRGW